MDEIRYEAADLKLCLHNLQAGKHILLAAENGWALCASSLHHTAVETLRMIAAEKESQPLTVLVGNEGGIEYLVQEVPEVAWELLEVSDRPLTLVLDKGKGIPSPALSPEGEIAVRVCREPFFRELLSRLKTPVVCSSIGGFGSLREVPARWQEETAYISTYKNSPGIAFQKEYRIKLGRGGLVSIL